MLWISRCSRELAGWKQRIFWFLLINKRENQVKKFIWAWRLEKFQEEASSNQLFTSPQMQTILFSLVFFSERPWTFFLFPLCLMLYSWRTNTQSICFLNMFLWISERKITFISWSFLQGLLVELLSRSIRVHEILLATEYDLIWSSLTVLSSGKIIKLDTGSQIGSTTWGSDGSMLGRVNIAHGVANKILWGPAWAWAAKKGKIIRNAKDWHPSVSATLSFVEEIRFASDNDDRYSHLNAAHSAISKNVQLWRFRHKAKDWILITQIVFLTKALEHWIIQSVISVSKWTCLGSWRHC